LCGGKTIREMASMWASQPLFSEASCRAAGAVEVVDGKQENAKNKKHAQSSTSEGEPGAEHDVVEQKKKKEEEGKEGGMGPPLPVEVDVLGKKRARAAMESYMGDAGPIFAVVLPERVVSEAASLAYPCFFCHAQVAGRTQFQWQTESQGVLKICHGCQKYLSKVGGKEVFRLQNARQRSSISSGNSRPSTISSVRHGSEDDGDQSSGSTRSRGRRRRKKSRLQAKFSIPSLAPTAEVEEDGFSVLSPITSPRVQGGFSFAPSSSSAPSQDPSANGATMELTLNENNLQILSRQWQQPRGQHPGSGAPLLVGLPDEVWSGSEAEYASETASQSSYTTDFTTYSVQSAQVLAAGFGGFTQPEQQQQQVPVSFVAKLQISQSGQSSQGVNPQAQPFCPLNSTDSQKSSVSMLHPTPPSAQGETFSQDNMSFHFPMPHADHESPMSALRLDRIPVLAWCQSSEGAAMLVNILSACDAESFQHKYVASMMLTRDNLLKFSLAANSGSVLCALFGKMADRQLRGEVLGVLQPHWQTLFASQHGPRVVECLLTRCSKDSLQRLLGAVATHTLALLEAEQGARVLLAVVHNLPFGVSKFVDLTFVQHCEAACTSRNAVVVLQALLQTRPAPKFGDVTKAVGQCVPALFEHADGCRVLGLLVERGSDPVRRKIVADMKMKILRYVGRQGSAEVVAACVLRSQNARVCVMRHTLGVTSPQKRKNKKRLDSKANTPVSSPAKPPVSSSSTSSSSPSSLLQPPDAGLSTPTQLQLQTPVKTPSKSKGGRAPEQDLECKDLSALFLAPGNTVLEACIRAASKKQLKTTEAKLGSYIDALAPVARQYWRFVLAEAKNKLKLQNK
jgi:hypothetical protein